MNQRRFLSSNGATNAQAKEAFVTGKFTPEVMIYLQKFNAATVAASIHNESITLTPAILALSEPKLCGIFCALPKDVSTVNFNFADLNGGQLNAALNLLAHAAYAKDVTSFHLTGPSDKSLTGKLTEAFQQFLPHAVLERVEPTAPRRR